MLKLSTLIERDARESSSQVFDRAYNEHTEALLQSLQSGQEEEEQPQEQEKVHHDSMNLRHLLAYKQQVKEDMDREAVLKQAA